MRIAVIGTANQGKSTFIDDMIKEWPAYKRSNESYRKVLKESGLLINKSGTEECQKVILDCLIEDIKQTRNGDHVLFDRCPMDNLVYSLWLFEQPNTSITKEFIKESIEKVKEAMRAFDIVFFTPITACAPVALEAKNTRECNAQYIQEIDNIFKAINYQHLKGICPFFVKDDAPPIIEIFGARRERIQMAKLYLNDKGDAIDTSASVLAPENLDMMEALLREQGFAVEDEKKLKGEKNKIIGAKLGDKLKPIDVFSPSQMKNRRN